MQKIKFTALAFILVLCLCVVSACPEADPDPETPSVSPVTSIRLRCNNVLINGNTLNAFYQEGHLTFTANVVVTDDKVSTDFTLTSSDTSVATVTVTDTSKQVILQKAGVTTLTGTAVGDNNRRHVVTLTVIDTSDTPGLTTKPSNITNNFGQNASTEFLAQWHNNSSVGAQKLQIVPEASDFTDPRVLIEVTAAGENFSTAAFWGSYSARNVYRAHVTNLTPDTGYKYRMGNYGQWSDEFSHRTSGTTSSTDSFSFTVVSDPQDTEFTTPAITFRSANAYDPDHRFFLICGDITDYPSTRPQEWVNYANMASEFIHTRPIVTILGNHDVYGIDGRPLGNPAGAGVNNNTVNRFVWVQVPDWVGSSVTSTWAAADWGVFPDTTRFPANSGYPHSGWSYGNGTFRRISHERGYFVHWSEGRTFNAFTVFPKNGFISNIEGCECQFCEAAPTVTEKDIGQSYYFYYNNVLFIMLNTIVSDDHHLKQAEWLDNLLKHDRANNLSKYTIIATHFGLFGNHYWEYADTHGPWDDQGKIPFVREVYGKIITDHGVDIVFSGHDHTYARSNPFKIGEDTSLDAIDFGPTPGGTVFSIAGSTGPKSYAPHPDSNSYARISQLWAHRTTANAASDSGILPGMFINVQVTPEKLIVNAIRRSNTTNPTTSAQAVGQVKDTYEVLAKR